MAISPSVRLEMNNARFKHWDSISITQTLNALSGISISMPNPAGLYTNLSIEDMPIKVWLGWDTADPPLQFDGYHDDPLWSVAKAKLGMSLTGRDFGRILFDEDTVDSAFNTYGNPINKGYIIDYIRYLNQHLSAPLSELFQRNTTVDSSSDFEYTFAYEKALDEVKKLIVYGGYEWLMTYDQDNNRRFIVRPPRDLIAGNVTHAFIVGEKSLYTDIPTQAAVHHIEAIGVKKQFGFKKNYVKVQGNGVSAVYPLSPPSSPKHLYHEDDGITTVADAQAVAQQLWNQKSAPKILVDFSGIGVEQLRVGDVIYVNDYRYGASQLPSHIFRLIGITNTITKGSGWKATFKVADFAPTLFQFFDGTTGL